MDITKLITPESIEAPTLNEKELSARAADISMMNNMVLERDQAHAELDGQTYLEYYESNRKKDLSYLEPKKNKQDVRISTGLTREKDSTLVSTALNMNFAADITAFDSDNLMEAELGDNMGDHVKKSNEIENWEKKRPIIYREMVAQGDVFVQELLIDDFREMPLEDVEWSGDTDKIADFSIKTRMQKVFSGCARRMIDGRKVYLAKVRGEGCEYIEDQEAVAIVNIYSRSRAYSKYGTWERWKNIPTAIESNGMGMDGNTYKSWNMVPCTTTEVAEVMLWNPISNRFQIYLNGVPLLPHNYLMTMLCPSGELPFAQGKLEPISGFAYSKSQPSKIKVDQAVLDETTKLMIEGMRQGRKPPMGSRGKKAYSKRVFYAGNIETDTKEGDLFSVLPNPGLQSSDFSFYQLVKNGIDDKTINKTFEGQNQQGDQTLGQIQQDKQQQMLKLGLAIDGFMNLERRMTWLRIYNILQNWTKKYDPNVDSTREKISGVYRNFSVNTTLSTGERGVKMFRYTTDKYPTPGEQAREEQKLSDKHGQEVRIVYMNPELLRTIKYTWFIVINPTTKSNDQLTQILFVQNLRSAMEIFGPDSINADYAKQRYAVLINEDYNKFFKKMDVQQMMQLGLNDPTVQNAMGKSGDQTGMGGGMKSASGARRTPMKAAVQ